MKATVFIDGGFLRALAQKAGYQDRQAIPRVLPLRREGKGDRLCMDE